MANITGRLPANFAEVQIRRKRRIFQNSNTQGYPLRNHVDLHHPLVKLVDMIPSTDGQGSGQDQRRALAMPDACCAYSLDRTSLGTAILFITGALGTLLP